MHEACPIAHGLTVTHSVETDLTRRFEGLLGSTFEHHFGKVAQHVGVHHAQHGAHFFKRHVARAEGDGLIEQRQAVAHGASGGARKHIKRCGFCRNAFLLHDVLHMTGNGRWRHVFQIELQAAGKHRHGNLLRIGRREDELDVFGRLFQSL